MKQGSNNSLVEYFLALERLAAGKPIRVSRDSKICNDSVSMEAGRGKGSIKRSRAVFGALIQAIEEAAAKQMHSETKANKKLNSLKAEVTGYKDALDEALAREVSLLYEIYELKRQIAQLNGGKVIPIRPTARQPN
jgi:hypothetical protein